MKPHIATINGLHFSPADFVKAKEREQTIRDMARDLVAAAYGKLDLRKDEDVVKFLFNDASRPWGWPLIRDHATAATHLARETIAAAAEGLR